MRPIEWLERHIPGFAALSEPERQAIFQFTVLWSLFEAKALDTGASAKAIIQRIRVVEGEGRLVPEQFEQVLEYFSARYFVRGMPTHHFGHLHLRNGDQADLVSRVLRLSLIHI